MQHNGCDKGDGTAVSLKVMRYRYSYLSLSKEGADKDGGHVKQERDVWNSCIEKRKTSFFIFFYTYLCHMS